MGDPTDIPGMTVKWAAVKTVDINDTVDEDFIRTIKSWSYTRIPVIGKRERKVNRPDHWEGTKIFGFLHVKYLIGMDIRASDDGGHTRLLVKDLPLNPLPIVNEDMSIYELLNMFQLGISRMAIVVAHPSNDHIDNTYSSPNTSFSCLKIPLWMPSKSSKVRVKLRSGRSGVNGDWTVDYLKAAKANAGGPKRRAFGIRSPQPIGIVTFGDLIDTLLQKTTRNESGFFDRNTTVPAKSNKIIDYVMERSRETIEDGGREVAASERTNIKESTTRSDTGQASSQDLTQKGTMRRRNISKKVKSPALDGVTDDSSDGIRADCVDQHPLQSAYGESSYTQNSEGGFHGNNDYSRSFDNAVVPAYDGNLDIADTSPSNDAQITDSIAKARTSSLPCHKSNSRALSESSKYPRRHFSAAPRVPPLRRVTPFSKHSYSSYERIASVEIERQGLLLQPADLEEDDVSEASDNESLCDHQVREDSGEANVGEDYNEEIYNAPLAISAASGNDIVPSPTRSNQASSRKCSSVGEYDGFPSELLDPSYNQENRLPNYAPKTLPRIEGSKSIAITLRDTPDSDLDNSSEKVLLQSTRKVPNINTNFEAGRSSSLWY
ncbi:uncharacterized protein BP5553_06681 [Venustampulla echinocandica]|uniref:CBS domain-containing protein n=1 Tax=Venustampulla echinocandica TaxID=2656787 RepID=A0A370TKM8_9HELO|nr:uncharacterized protein BP5553_06681 [Venustampulla echinocandica]RDL36069.1 hypothetical protein BP5553_06681 [Venustampulla echinocandica]